MYKSLILLVTFLGYVTFLYLWGFNESSILPYLNLTMYFVLFLVIRNTLNNTNLNKNIVKLYMVFFFYLAIFSTFPILTRNIKNLDYIVYVYFEISLKFLLLWLSFAIALSSFKKFVTESRLLWIGSSTFAFIIIAINYYEFIFDPLLLRQFDFWTQWQVKNYTTMVVSIIALVVFWIRYYLKHCVVSEFLDIIIFLFTISNSIEALHFVAYQHNLEIFINGQIISLLINIALLIFWIKRYRYLNTSIAIENERFLQNYYFLGGLVAKPHPNWFSQITDLISMRIIALVLAIVGLGIIGLFFIKQITFYLFINTIFLVVAIVMALFFGFSSIKREWNSTIGRLINKK